MAFKTMGIKDIDGTLNPVDTYVDLYTVPGGGVSGAVVSKLTISNRGSSPSAATVLLEPNGGTPGDVAGILLPGMLIPGDSVFETIVGHALETGAKIRVKASVADVNFVMSGDER